MSESKVILITSFILLSFKDNKFDSNLPANLFSFSEASWRYKKSVIRL